MRNKRDIKLKTYDDIFNVIENMPENDIKAIDINLLMDFRDHPYKVLDNKDMEELLESIKENGILMPILVRPVGEKYEIISGHRRKYCAKKIGISQVPCVIKDMDYDEAVLVMVDSNIQRKNILPSEKALAYKMKLNAIKKQGTRTDLSSCPVGTRSAEVVGLENNDSQRNVYRYVRLAELGDFLLSAVDNKKLSLRAGVDLSYLSKDELTILEGFIKEFNIFPSMEQASALKENTGNLSDKAITEIMVSPQEKDDPYLSGEQDSNIVFDKKILEKYFPENYSAKDIHKEIIRILENRK